MDLAGYLYSQNAHANYSFAVDTLIVPEGEESSFEWIHSAQTRDQDHAGYRRLGDIVLAVVAVFVGLLLALLPLWQEEEEEVPDALMR